MVTLSRKFLPVILAAPILLTAGCASQTDIDALRGDVKQALETARAAEAAARAADQKATRAEAVAQKAAEDAARAAEEAKMASEKADKIFRQSLRK